MGIEKNPAGQAGAVKRVTNNDTSTPTSREPTRRAESSRATGEAVEVLARMRIRSGVWLDKQEFNPLQWSVPGILPEGYCMIVAPPKAGKSWWVAAIGLACATGGKALGAIDVEERPVLYFALEDGDRRLKSRFKTIMDNNVIPREMNRVLEVGDLNELIVIAEFFQDQRARLLPPLIIVDTLGKVNPGRSSNQSAYNADYSVGSRLQNLAKRVPGCTVLAVHHTNKGEHGDFLNSVSGTQGVTGACDAVIVMQRARGSNDAVLSITGRDIEHEAEYAIINDGGRWVLHGGSLQSAEEAAQGVKAAQAEAVITAKYGDRTNAVLDAVNALADDDGREFITAKDIADELGIGNDMAGKYLRRLESSGQIVKCGRGAYRPLSEVSEVSYSQVIRDIHSDSHSDMSETVSECPKQETATDQQVQSHSDTSDGSDTYMKEKS